MSARQLRRGGAAALGLLLFPWPGALASPGRASGTPSASSASRPWSLDCAATRSGAATAPSACVFRATLRGRIDGSRLHQIEQAIRRRDTAARALGRDVALRVEADSPGGEIFAAMQIGRLLRRARASFSVGRGASCLSACVFALMGAVRTNLADGARIGIHRPSLGPGHDGPAELTSGPFVLYADEMRVSRRLVDDMLGLRADRIRLLGVADLAGYGIPASRSTEGDDPADGSA